MLMNVLQKYKKLLIGAGVVAVLFVGWNMFSTDPLPEGLTSRSVSNLPAEEGGDLIALLLELKSIKLDTAILQNPTFLTLQDFSVTLIPEPVGRVNPFAPLGDNAPRNTPVSTTTTATTTTQ